MTKLAKAGSLMLVMALVLTSCNCYTKMMKKTAPGIVASCSPEMLTLQGDDAVGTITVTIPAGTFHPQGVLKITPVLKFEGGELAGEPRFLQGEKIKGNYTTIETKKGGSYTQEVAFRYASQMRSSQLVLRVEAKCQKGGAKIKNFTPYNVDIPVANGVSTLQLMADNYAKVAIAPDSYVRTTEIKQSANIMFQVNKSDVRKEQLNSADVAALQKFINDNSANAKRTVGGVYTQSYASPEGPLEINNQLSKSRGESTKKAVKAKFAKDKTNAEAFDINAMGEDWEGFKELVANSNIQDKEIILQVLSMYNDPQVRDREIRNMSAAFTVLKEKILPELRRSKMTVGVKIDGLTDTELKAAIATDPSKLTAEEMLFAATLYNDNVTKAAIYKKAAEQYNDFRAWNNLGVIQSYDGNFETAKANFEKASRLNNSNPQVINNLGVVALAEGKKSEAAKFFAASTATEARYNKGLVELANGNYSSAISSLDGYNKGVAQMLNGDVTAAKATLASENSWSADYLKAVVAAKEGDTNALVANLKSAISNNPEAKMLAKTEAAFAKYTAIAEFAQLVGVK